MSKRKIRRRPSRPDIKFTRHTRRRMYEALSARIPATRAAVIAGTSKDTYMTWMRLGKDDPDTYPVHAEFRRRVIDIRRQLEAEALDVISRAAKGGDKVVETTVKMSRNGPEVTRTTKRERKQWQAAAWWLERTYPGDYAQRHILPEEGSMTPEEMARDIKSTFDAMMESVPSEV